MKYFLIVGEASGDLHAANLMKGLKAHDPHAEFRYMGGDLMKGVSDGLVMHYGETSYMMLDVIFHLGKIFRAMRKVKSEIIRWKPDVVIPVDYPGFNMRMARFSFTLGLKVFYFISPKVWAWKQRRVYQLKKYTNKLFVILPFEVDYFSKFDMKVEYFGNPLVDGVEEFRKTFEGEEVWKKRHQLGDQPIIALLAGSRRKEIQSMLPPMLKVAEGHSEFQFVVAGAPSIEPEFYEQFMQHSSVKIVYEETYALLECAEAGVITSGTATLEAALFDVPQVVLYKTGSLAYGIGKRLIKINFISLVNLIFGEELVQEVIQKRLYERTASAFKDILNDSNTRKKMLRGYKTMRSDLGSPGVANRLGQRMVALLNGEVE